MNQLNNFETFGVNIIQLKLANRNKNISNKTRLDFNKNSNFQSFLSNKNADLDIMGISHVAEAKVSCELLIFSLMK